jgi:adenine-specific DNA-methyltransferase
MMEKLNPETPDLAQAQIERLRELFPECVTEGPDGLVVDFDALRQALSSQVVEGPQERYRLDWPGKREAMAMGNQPTDKTLRPVRGESVDFDTTQNLFIEGDNLEALKIIQETYLGQVKMIYIDPPYNTGNDFIYRDDFKQAREDYEAESGQRNEAGERLVPNPESAGRFHSDWLSMMYPRLKLAKNLLADDGVIFVSIDFNESSNLKRIMDDVFGQENFQRQIVWRIGWLSGYKTAADNFIRNHDMMMFYSKSSHHFQFHKKYIENSEFKPLVKLEPKVRAKMEALGLSPEKQKDLLNFINHENRPERYPIEDTWNSNEYDDLNSIAIVSFSSEKISKILDIEQDFKGQKSVRMLQRILTASTSNNDLVLDFFGGTGSTAHAVMQLNAEDGGNRRFIMVQLPEACDEKSEAAKAGYANIAEISKERIRRAGTKIKEGECHEGWNQDIGFRVLKVDESNLNAVRQTPDATSQESLLDAVENIKPDRSEEDLLFDVMLRWGVDLAAPIERREIEGKTVFLINEDDLVACFAPSITEDFIKRLTDLKPLKIVFRDDAFASDDVKINTVQIFKQASPDTEVRSI